MGLQLRSVASASRKARILHQTGLVLVRWWPKSARYRYDTSVLQDVRIWPLCTTGRQRHPFEEAASANGEKENKNGGSESWRTFNIAFTGKIELVNPV